MFCSLIKLNFLYYISKKNIYEILLIKNVYIVIQYIKTGIIANNIKAMHIGSNKILIVSIVRQTPIFTKQFECLKWSLQQELSKNKAINATIPPNTNTIGKSTITSKNIKILHNINLIAPQFRAYWYSDCSLLLKIFFYKITNFRNCLFRQNNTLDLIYLIYFFI